MDESMNLDKIALPALTHFADKVSADALPHLGSLAHIGLFLSGKSRRLFFKGLAALFGEGNKEGMGHLLEVSELDAGLRYDAVREANRLRQKMDGYVEREYVRKFFWALRRARSLRQWYHLLDPYEGKDEDAVHSILDGTAFRSGGLVSRLLGENPPPAQEPAIKAKGQKTELPTYDKDARELRLGDVVMRRYGKDNLHEKILEAFQKAKWKSRIPIPACFYSDVQGQKLARKCLQDTIDQLNTAQKHKPMLIRFRVHDKEIVWERRQ
jgi:hypothetical protein